MWRNYRDIRYNSWTLQCNNLMPHSGARFLFPTESELCVPVCVCVCVSRNIKETLMHAAGLVAPCCCLAGLSGEFWNLVHPLHGAAIMQAGKLK